MVLRYCAEHTNRIGTTDVKPPNVTCKRTDQTHKLTMKIYQHQNSEKTKIGSVDITSGQMTFFDPYPQTHFPNRLDQILDNGNFEVLLYKFKNPPKDNGIIAIEVVFKNSEPIKWQDANYFEDPKSDFHYTNSCGFISDTSIFQNETIISLNDRIDKVATTRNENELNYCQLEFDNKVKCVYFECGIGWYDQVVDLKWGFDNEEKICRLLVDFYSYLL